MTSSPLGASVVRGLFLAFLTFAAGLLTLVQTLERHVDGSRDWETAAIAAGSAALTALIARVGGEGLYDQHRDNVEPPAVTASDVGVKA